MLPQRRIRTGKRSPGHRLPGAIALTLSFSLLAACQSAPGSLAWLAPAGQMPGRLETGSGVRAAGESPGPQTLDTTLRCRVLFPGEAGPGDRQVQATAAQVTREATVALLDTATGQTLAAGRTDASGNATLAPNSSFVPAGSYYLRVIAPASSTAVGASLVSMATVVRWTDTGWASITNGTGGSGQIAINPTTTAVMLIQASDPDGTGIDQIMGVVSGTDYTAVTAFTTHLASEVAAWATEVTNKLGQGVDPLENALLAATAHLAPDDAGDPTVHHDYVLKKGGVASTFVWVPVFEAYQLINPTNCGYSSTTPRGAWVAAPPSSGTEAPAGTSDGNWARERFGGFYAAKYEASRSNATANDAGNSGTLKVAQGVVPWTGINWDEAALTALSYHPPYSHLMRDDEWAALAVWSMIRGLAVHGNNINGSLKDADDDNITFSAYPNSSGRALTGTGTRAGWSVGTNLTTHTGKTVGVHDLNGNVWEFTETIGVANGYYITNDITLPIGLTGGDGYIGQLSTEPRLRRYGVPGARADSATADFGSDYLWLPGATSAKVIRGGGLNGSESGVWALYFGYQRTWSGPDVGFRPVLRFF